MGPRDCGALEGVLGTRKRVKTRSGGPREQRLGSYHRSDIELGALKKNDVIFVFLVV